MSTCLLATRLHNRPELWGRDRFSATTVPPGRRDAPRSARRAYEAEQSDSTTLDRHIQWLTQAAGLPKRSVGRAPFFCWYNGSGRLMRCLARFQASPSRSTACRMVSPLTSDWVSPSCWQISANRSQVQTLVGLPKERGPRCISSCKRGRSRSSLAWCKQWGREEPACSTAKPLVLKPLMTLRTVWSSQPSCLAMAVARSWRADASKIWQHRRTKASDERRPALSCCCSFSLNGRTKMGALMVLLILHLLSPVLTVH